MHIVSAKHAITCDEHHRPLILTALLHVSPQVSGRARASAKCWDTRTDAGAPRPPGPTPAWPARPKCPPSPGRHPFPGTPGGKTTIRLSCLKPAGCKVCMKKFSTRSSTIFLLVPRHRPGYRRRMRSPSQNTQTLKESSKNKNKNKKNHQIKDSCLNLVQYFDPI